MDQLVAAGAWQRLSRDLVAVCLTLVAALAAVGCGGTTRLSKTAFEARANATCERADAEIQALPAHKSGTLSALANDAAGLVPIIDQLAPRLHRLIPPVAYQAQWMMLLHEMDAMPKLLSKMRAAALSGDGPEVQALGDQINGMDMNSIAIGLGLGECARDLQPAGSSQ
jgi:hypothetical protein